MLMSGGTITPNQLQNQRKPIVLRIWYSYQLLILTLHKLSKNSSLGHFLMNKMTVHLNMFCSSIHNWIICPVQHFHYHNTTQEQIKRTFQGNKEDTKYKSFLRQWRLLLYALLQNQIGLLCSVSWRSMKYNLHLGCCYSMQLISQLWYNLPNKHQSSHTTYMVIVK